MKIKDTVGVVTGGGREQGRLCRRFAREGAKGIVVADINEALAKNVADQINGAAFKCDVSREEEVKQLVRFAEEKFGFRDLFCSNAGILFIGGRECPNYQWQRIWEVNVMSHTVRGGWFCPQ